MYDAVNGFTNKTAPAAVFTNGMLYNAVNGS